MIRVLFTLALMAGILGLAANNHDHRHTTLILALVAVQLGNATLYFAARRRP